MSLDGNRLPAHKPSVTAGLRWQPEMWPMAYAMVSRVRPNASEMPTLPAAEPASTAVPQPPRTSHSVPINSAETLLVKGITGNLLLKTTIEKATCSFLLDVK